MGLDMYLSARKVLTEYSFENGKNTEAINNVLSAIGWERSDMTFDSPVISVELPVMYWRKANHIHRWFVDNIQDGDDDCGTYQVSRQDIQELTDLCAEALADKDNAEDILPRESGFFFGSTDYDEWYWEQTQDTYDTLSKILANPKLEGCSFEYSSSW